ncbi:TetR/AcrR family transcriptional regulator [Bradyrhizobium sp. CCBAU 53421]|uniref:TetR/AcrR family transcriptional regulator n=1 Tax=Bradyrhizobium sp. CCBAU 53421 TaxID=1325120 RepID=UPI00188DA730|nr:TetR/AcrR family transcriptional regulator [Bradyrhizobium sp. CCBAU 53421]
MVSRSTSGLSSAKSSVKTADGRRQRTQVTRGNIVSACIALQNEGSARPSAQQIAERAGVSIRTLFLHFPEKGQLTQAVLDELTPPESIEPPPAKSVLHGAVEVRVAQFIDMRAQALERMTPHRRASNAMIETSPLLQKHRLRVRKAFRDVVGQWFATELEQVSAEARQKWLVALATLLDWEMWQSLRTYPNRSIAEAKDCLTLLLKAALRQMEAERS